MNNLICKLIGHKREKENFWLGKTIFEGGKPFYCSRCKDYLIEYFYYPNDAIWIEKMTNKQKKYFLKHLPK